MVILISPSSKLSIALADQLLMLMKSQGLIIITLAAFDYIISRYVHHNANSPWLYAIILAAHDYMAHHLA